MSPDERKELIAQISAKLEDLDDDELLRIAVDHDVPTPKTEMEKRVDAGESPLSLPTIDTSVLTGPINGLKNFLMQKQRDNDSKS